MMNKLKPQRVGIIWVGPVLEEQEAHTAVGFVADPWPGHTGNTPKPISR